MKKLVAGNPRITFVDIGNRFLRDDGTIPKELMGGYLHPTHAATGRTEYAIMFAMKPIPRDSGSFLAIRNAGQLYVDKTAYFHRLVTAPDAKCFFLARPRRFGKSLMITTLKEIFNGRRDLFEDLVIAKTDYDWKKHPVLHFDFGNSAEKTTYEDFDAAFCQQLRDVLHDAGCDYEAGLPPGMNFGRAIDALATRDPKALPVILIDEYDDPVAKVLDRVELAEKVRDRMASFFGQLKSRTDKFRFLMITGVSKFTKMSIFSTLSNLVDISDDDDYATMLGYTEAELDEYFTEPMAEQAAKMGLSMEAYRAELRRMYNGYRFWLEEGENVYNPVSINLDMAHPKKMFRCYWSSTGRASSLMNLLKRGDMLALDLDNLGAVKSSAFDVSDLRHLMPIGMLYQTGYLTISGYNPVTETYRLCVPDEEVRRDLMTVYASLVADKDTVWISTLGASLQEGDFDRFFIGLKSLYAGLPYGSTEESVHEASFTRNLIVLLQSQGFRISPERVTSDGRIDLVADHPCGTYIFELKVDQPPAIAMSQAERKDYAAPFVAAQKPIWLVGLSFERDTRKFLAGTAERYVPA